MKNFKIILVFVFTLSMCKTEKKIQSSRRPTINIITQREINIPAPFIVKEIHDTITIVKENIIIQKEYIVDSSIVVDSIDREQYYKNRIANLEFLLAKSRIQHYHSVIIQKKLDTTTRAKNKALREIARTKEIIYVWPKYLLVILFLLIITLLLYKLSLKQKLKRKIIHKRNANSIR